MRETTVYGLVDPRSGEIRYVGKTVSPVNRLRGHLRDARRLTTEKAKWIATLLDDGCEPELRILAVVSFVDAQQVEKEWIAKLPNLTNMCPGSPGGVPGRSKSDEFKANLSRYWKARGGIRPKGFVVSDSTRQKMREARLRERHPCDGCGMVMNAGQHARHVCKIIRSNV